MADAARDGLLELTRLLMAHVSWQRELGAVEFERAGALPVSTVSVVAPPLEPHRSPVVTLTPARELPLPAVLPSVPERVALRPTGDGAEVVDEDPRRAALRVIQREVEGCTRCKLSVGRTQTVFARGDPAARLCFVGEGPGEQEDLQGLPFVGPAGQLLDKIIVAMGLTPDTVYVANIVKCRPPNNRTPEHDEMTACTPYLARQLELVRPEVIVALGRTAVGFLLDTRESLGKLRGRWSSYKGIPVLPTWHPSYLLRYPEHKKNTWDDMKLVLERLGLAPPMRR